LYSSSNIRENESRRVKWVGYVALPELKYIESFSRKKCIKEIRYEGMTDSSGPGQGHMAQCHEHNNERFGSVKDGYFLTS
jgi:hypothetical protein